MGRGLGEQRAGEIAGGVVGGMAFWLQCDEKSLLGQPLYSY